MIHRPDSIGTFEFVLMASQRAAQLMRGCLPRVPVGVHKVATVAQFEVASGKVKRMAAADAIVPIIL